MSPVELIIVFVAWVAGGNTGIWLERTTHKKTKRDPKTYMIWQNVLLLALLAWVLLS